MAQLWETYAMVRLCFSFFHEDGVGADDSWVDRATTST